jgi:hypothetical protein
MNRTTGLFCSEEALRGGRVTCWPRWRDPHPPPDEDQACSVCGEQAGAEPLRVTECGHAFHETCLRPWLNQKDTCPVCRQPLAIDVQVEWHHNRPAEPAGPAGQALTGPVIPNWMAYHSVLVTVGDDAESDPSQQQTAELQAPAAMNLSTEDLSEMVHTVFTDQPGAAGRHSPGHGHDEDEEAYEEQIEEFAGITVNASGRSKVIMNVHYASPAPPREPQ